MNSEYYSQSQRYNDLFIIDDIYSIIPSYVENINAYILYLNVFPLSAITNIKGDCLILDIVLEDKENPHITSISLGHSVHLQRYNHNVFDTTLSIKNTASIINT